jgi:hypothetical protein
MMAFIRGFMLHLVLIALVLVVGFLCGMLVGWLWPWKAPGTAESAGMPSLRATATVRAPRCSTYPDCSGSAPRLSRMG